MNMLIYGGCHALVMRDYLRLAFPNDIDCSLLVNFDLIRSGTSFPYDTLGLYDVVVFSPIENKGGYNTVHLVEACRSRGIKAVCYPWMEWHGYCPGAEKGCFKNHVQWFYPQLVERAATFGGTFDEFCDDVIATCPADDVIDQVLEDSTEHLRRAERRHDIRFSLADAVVSHFRDSRMFLISDHPSRACYLYVLEQILALAGVSRQTISEGFARLPEEEPQWRWRTPILPRVGRRLGLSFEDSEWRDDVLLPGCTLDLRAYLRLYYEADAVGRATMGLRALPQSAGSAGRDAGRT